MSPEQKAVRLAQIAEQVDSAADLVTAANLAVSSIPQSIRKAVAELLHAVGDRLGRVARVSAEANAEEPAA